MPTLSGKTGHANADAEPARAVGVVRHHRRHESHQRQQGHDQQVLEQEDRDDLLAARQGDVATFPKQLHDDGRGGQHEPGGADERHGQAESERQAHPGQRYGAGEDLQSPQPEDLPTQAPQMRGLHLQPDHEQEHDHAQFGHVQDRLRLGKPAEAERADDQASGKISQHRAQPEPPENRHHDHCRSEQRHDLDQVT